MNVELLEELFGRDGLASSTSKSTLSGTTMAHEPCSLSSVLTCWRKLSCLFFVLVQKS